MPRVDDLFGGPDGSPRTDKLIAASIQWATLIMEKIDMQTVEIGIGGVVAHSPLPHHLDMRVRIRRFSSVELRRIQQPWNAERVEVSKRKRGGQCRAVS
jgi:hypothetical protein